MPHRIGCERVTTLGTLELGAKPMHDAIIMVAVTYITWQRRHKISLLVVDQADSAAFKVFEPWIIVRNFRCPFYDAFAEDLLFVVSLVLVVLHVAQTRRAEQRNCH